MARPRLNYDWAAATLGTGPLRRWLTEQRKAAGRMSEEYKPTPAEELVQRALDVGLFDEAGAAIETMDRLQADPDLEEGGDRDGGSNHKEDEGLATNDLLDIKTWCPCCGAVSSEQWSIA